MMSAEQAARSELEAYVDSMPADYASVFEARDIREHARIVLARGERTVALEVWRTFRDGSCALVLVADDRPGLLSFVAAALVENELVVQDAQAFCRQCADGRSEAVDLFWLTGPGEHGLDEPTLDRVRRRLTEMIENADELALVDADNPFEAPTLVTSVPTRVSFDERALRRGKHVLVVETRDVMGLMLSISSTLHRMGIAIEASDIRTNGELAHDRFTLGCKTGVLDEARMRDVAERVTMTIQALHAAQRA